MARLLVGFDGSPPSRRALDLALRRARNARDAILVVTAIPAQLTNKSFAAMMPAGVELHPAVTGTFWDHARGRVDDVVAEGKAQGIHVEGRILQGQPAEALLLAAEEWRADEILIGHKSYQGPGFTLGPHADALVRGARLPVTVVP